MPPIFCKFQEKKKRNQQEICENERKTANIVCPVNSPTQKVSCEKLAKGIITPEALLRKLFLRGLDDPHPLDYLSPLAFSGCGIAFRWVVGRLGVGATLSRVQVGCRAFLTLKREQHPFSLSQALTLLIRERPPGLIQLVLRMRHSPTDHHFSIIFIEKVTTNRPKSAKILSLLSLFTYLWPLPGCGMFFCPVEGRVVLKACTDCPGFPVLDGANTSL